MKLPVSEKLYSLSKACPFPLYIVGGYVRDCLGGLYSCISDVDICAPASADEFCAAALKCGAEVVVAYRNTGTVKLRFGEEEYEFASFRSDEYVRGVHKPVNTFFTSDIVLDAIRRDFKCNAVYYDIKEDKLVDPLGGIEDIQCERLTTVAAADKVFGEDGLRLMRLARQSAQTGFKPTAECIEGAKANSPLIADISAERVYAELDAILHADVRYGRQGAQYEGVKLLDQTGVLDYILPELTLGRGMKQNSSFHNFDVLEHSLRAVKYSADGVRLAALLHDTGKPYCMLKDGNYHGHETESARIAEQICIRLKVPKRLTAEVVRLCALHMYDLRCDARENKIRKLIVKNFDIFEKLLLIKQADYSACKDNTDEAPCVTKWKDIYCKMKEEGAPFTLKQLAVRGNELIDLNVPPAQVGKVLDLLLEDCAIDPALNSKEKLLKRAAALYGAGAN